MSGGSLYHVIRGNVIFPSQRMDVGLALFSVEELVDVREHRHGRASPLGVRSGPNGEDILTYFVRFCAATNCDKLSDLSIRHIHHTLHGRVSRSVVGEIVKRVRHPTS